MNRLVFLGTPEFAVPTLQALLTASDMAVLAVVTQPDRPSGRGQKLAAPPVKLSAQAAGVTVFQTQSIRKDPDLIAQLQALSPDFFVTAAFGQILPQAVLDIPARGTVNVHASLLPELRGANPVQWAILQNMTQTGVTTMLTDIGVDTGPMLMKTTVAIDPDETAESLLQRLAQVGAPLLLETLRGLAEGWVQPQPQDSSQATHAPKLNKTNAWLDWATPSITLHNRIRGQQPWPGAQTRFGDQPLKILASTLVGEPDGDDPRLGDYQPGQWMVSADGLRVRTGDGSLLITRVQPPGKPAMAARDWANGALARSLIKPEEPPCFAGAHAIVER